MDWTYFPAISNSEISMLPDSLTENDILHPGLNGFGIAFNRNDLGITALVAYAEVLFQPTSIMLCIA